VSEELLLQEAAKRITAKNTEIFMAIFIFSKQLNKEI
jgi:hypothetical protein